MGKLKDTGGAMRGIAGPRTLRQMACPWCLRDDTTKDETIATLRAEVQEYRDRAERVEAKLAMIRNYTVQVIRATDQPIGGYSNMTDFTRYTGKMILAALEVTP